MLICSIKHIVETIGETIHKGNYRIIEPIGSGFFGRVLKCIRIIDGQIVAVKQTPGKASEFDKLRRECRILVELKHPNIVRYFEAFIENHSDKFEKQMGKKWLCIVVEYCGGGTLDTHISCARKRFLTSLTEIQQPVLDIEKIHCVALSVGRALAYLHSKSIIHRDVKSDNILFTEDYSVKLGDFGLAKEACVSVNNAISSNATLQLTTWNDPRCIPYASPEVQRGEQYSGKVDIWALGCVILEMVTGTFIAEICPERMALCEVEGALESLLVKAGSILSIHWTELIGGMLERDRSKRWSASQVIERLEQMIGKEKNDLTNGSTLENNLEKSGVAVEDISNVKSSDTSQILVLDHSQVINDWLRRVRAIALEQAREKLLEFSSALGLEQVIHCSAQPILCDKLV